MLSFLFHEAHHPRLPTSPTSPPLALSTCSRDPPRTPVPGLAPRPTRPVHSANAAPTRPSWFIASSLVCAPNSMAFSF